MIQILKDTIKLISFLLINCSTTKSFYPN